MPHIIFLRHGKLLLPYKDHSEMPFSVFADLGSGILNPPIDAPEATVRLEEIQNNLNISNTRSVLTSPATRCQETSALLVTTLCNQGREIVPVVSEHLAEVKFDLRALDSEGRIEKALKEHDIVTVNNAVFSAMVSGKDCEPVADAYYRVEQLFKSSTQELPCIFISHDFIMRVIEIYIRRHGAPYSEISFDDLVSTRRNTYLSGFATNIDLKMFTKI